MAAATRWRVFGDGKGVLGVMKMMFNLTTSAEDLDRFPERKDLLELMHGFDGVELMQFEEDSREIIPKECVIGFHMGYFPCWLDFGTATRMPCLKNLTIGRRWSGSLAVKTAVPS